MEERLLDKKVQEELKVLKEARKKELIQIVEKVKALKESPLKVTVVLQMKAIRRDYKQLLKQKKREAEIRDIKQLSESFKMNDMKVFWREIQDPEKRKSTQQKCPEPETWPPYFEIGNDTTPLGVLNSIPTEGNCFPLQELDYSLLEETKEEEIKNILKNQKGGTAPGLDGIPIMVYNKFALSFVPIMVFIFNAILSTHKWPEAWKTSVILPLFKKGNAEEHSNYRPISLIPTMSKIFEKIIDVILSKWLDVYEKIKEEQGGFRARYNTADRMFVLHALSEKY
ncbi:hypothetical protein QYM36_019066 [Artemia franciscana]|uniref:Reverse transcriptase domain-containing protein n=1 Tax=Artemia franciscana TaxID=6661 RepID=A0AA88H8F6_ARTSF|nr:hypothetical protein QYM36_019066 [Artemia franciscana]